MQETFTVTVTTEDGKCLKLERTTGDWLSLSLLLSQLSNLFRFHYEVGLRSEIEPGSGIGQSALDSSLLTAS